MYKCAHCSEEVSLLKGGLGWRCKDKQRWAFWVGDVPVCCNNRGCVASFLEELLTSYYEFDILPHQRWGPPYDMILEGIFEDAALSAKKEEEEK